jgi:hypothetical protein
MATVGVSIGVAWASLGVFLSSLAFQHNICAAMGIKAVFLAIASFAYGYIRLSTPRLFLLVLLMIIPMLTGLVRIFGSDTNS